jgi:hypothetical protein
MGSIFLNTAVEGVQKGFSSSLSISGLLSGCLSRPGKPSQHQPDHREIDHILATARQVFIILAHSSMPSNPRKRSFHHPSARQDMETRRNDRRPIDLSPLWHPDAPQARPGMLDDLGLSPHLLLNPLPPCARIAHVEPHLFHAGKDRFERL